MTTQAHRKFTVLEAVEVAIENLRLADPSEDGQAKLDELAAEFKERDSVDGDTKATHESDLVSAVGGRHRKR